MMKGIENNKMKKYTAIAVATLVFLGFISAASANTLNRQSLSNDLSKNGLNKVCDNHNLIYIYSSGARNYEAAAMAVIPKGC